MATYNGEKFIREQIESILSQLGTNDELIISDDGSTDDTIKIINSICDPRIKIFHNQGRRGFVGNFENALRNAQNDYIFLSDQDDIWKKDKVKIVLQALEDYDLIVHDAEIIDGDGNPLGMNYYSIMHHYTNFFMNLWKTRWLGCCMAFRKEVLFYCLPFPSNIVAHDYWIGMLGMLKFQYCFLNDVLICYRRHGGNVSPSGEKSNYSLFYKLFTKRMNLLISLIKRLCKIW